LSPVGFDPRGVYDLPVQSAFFRRFLREPCEIYLGRFYCFMPSCAGRGVPSDASITGSELHPGSLRTGPTVSREERRRLKRKREAKQTDRRYAYERMPFEAVNKIEEVARDPEKVVPQSGVYLVAIIRRDCCNLCYVFSHPVAYVRVDSGSSSTHTDLWKGSVKASRRVHRREGDKKRNVWEEGRGTFKNFKWEWTKGSICLRSRVFHRPCRQLAAVLLKTISIPSRDTHFLSPFFQLHLFLPLSGITSRIVSSRSEDEARGSIGTKFLLLSLKKIFSREGNNFWRISCKRNFFDFFNNAISPGGLPRRNGLGTTKIIENVVFLSFTISL
ncbi:hypothetical protein ALC57_06520, partial [Trachymyrmex cornetzi]